jgi:hypothetical protein
MNKHYMYLVKAVEFCFCNLAYSCPLLNVAAVYSNITMFFTREDE